PISKGKSSFLVSARQSLLDPNQWAPNRSDIDAQLFFTDINLKMNWKINETNTLFVSGYLGQDRSTTVFDTEQQWGNRTFTARWNRQYGQRLFNHVSLVMSEFNYEINEPREAGAFKGRFRVLNYSLKADQSFYASPKSLFNFGISSTLHRLKPGERLPFDPDDSSTNPLELDSEHGLESALYGSHEWTINPKLKLLYGVRISSLLNIGPAEKQIYAPGEPRTEDAVVGIDTISGGKIFDPFLNFEPRISLNWSWRPTVALKASYNRTYQYIHLISNTITPNPTDVWKLSDRFIPPTRTDHFSLGLYQNFKEDEWEGYLEGYFKNVDNAIEYRDGADLLFNPAIETELLQATGRAYGLELFAKKNRGKNKGWISYTLSRVEKKIISDFQEDLINGGEFFPDDNDRTHDLSIVYIRQLLPRLGLSTSFNYSTGRPITLPVGKYTFEGNPIPHFAGRNENRISDYHRLDLSLRWEGRRLKKDGSPRKYSDYWTFTVYNAYGRKNAFSYFFRASEDMPGETEIVRYSVFFMPFPSLTYNFKF
ncbi:MAG: TonB-dependent receptor, partial [Bacteroidota bacterium]